MSKESIENGYTQFVKTQVIMQSIHNIGITDFGQYQYLLYKIANSLDTEEELQNFIAFIAKVFQLGYFKSASDHKEALRKIGYTSDLDLPKS